MGQAKRRGTFAERNAAALKRNEAIVKRLQEPTADPAIVKYRRRWGTQRLATRLVAAGLVGLVPVPRKETP